MPRKVHDGLFKRCGHSVRAWTTCGDAWWFRFHHGGREYRFSLNREEQKPLGYKMDKEEAQLQNKYRLQIQEGRFRQESAKSTDLRLTVGDVMNQYVENHVRAPERKPAGRVVMEAYVNRLGAMKVPAANGTTVALKDKPIDGVTAADLDVLRRDWSINAKAAAGGHTAPVVPSSAFVTSSIGRSRRATCSCRRSSAVTSTRFTSRRSLVAHAVLRMTKSAAYSIAACRQ